LQVLVSTTSACRSPVLPLPPSIGVSGPRGYGPGSLSPAYWKVTGTFWCEESTSWKGMPYGTEPPEGPQSGWMSCDGPPLEAIHAALWESTGSPLMSVFQTLSAGSAGHGPMLGEPVAATGSAGVTGVASSAPSTASRGTHEREGRMPASLDASCDTGPTAAQPLCLSPRRAPRDGAAGSPAGWVGSGSTPRSRWTAGRSP